MKRTDSLVEIESVWTVVQMASQGYPGGEVEGAYGSVEDGEVTEDGRFQNRHG